MNSAAGHGARSVASLGGSLGPQIIIGVAMMVIQLAIDQVVRAEEAPKKLASALATAATITATHQFSRLSGCAVVPFFHRREGADYVLRIGAPLEDFPSSDAAVDSTRVNAAIEAMVREAPTQYLWIHRRFKRRPPGMTSPYGKR